LRTHCCWRVSNETIRSTEAGSDAEMDVLADSAGSGCEGDSGAQEEDRTEALQEVAVEEKGKLKEKEEGGPQGELVSSLGREGKEKNNTGQSEAAIQQGEPSSAPAGEEIQAENKVIVAEQLVKPLPVISKEAAASAIVKMEDVKQHLVEIDDRWARDMFLMRSATSALFKNDIELSEKLLEEGFNSDPATLEKGERDIRGSFALVYALVALMKGIASFSDDSLRDCGIRLRAADELAAKDANWIGKKVVRGICTLCIGLIDLLERKLVSGVYKILKSWTWIRTMKTEALDYQGKEREVVRSCALFTLGAFYILISMLPPRAKSIASWLTFNGSRQEGLDLLIICFKEVGLLSPWAALVLLSFHVDTKTFLGEPLTEQEIQMVREIVDWSEKTYPGSLFYRGLVADFFAVTERNLAKAKSMLEADASTMKQFPALEWVLHYKRGAYALCSADWKEAASHFRDSMVVYEKVGRRSMVPFMAAYTLLCKLQSAAEGIDEDTSMNEAKEMVAILKKYKAMKKSDWGRQDTFGFEIMEKYQDFEENGASDDKKGRKKGFFKRSGDKKEAFSKWPLLNIMEIIVLQIRSTWWMDQAGLENLQAKLFAEMESQDPPIDDKLRAMMCTMDLFRQMGKLEDSLKVYDEALALESKITKEGKSFGAVPMMHFFAAQLFHIKGDLAKARSIIQKVKSYGTNYDLHPLIVLKLTNLQRAIGLDLDEDFESLDIPAGQKKTIEIAITPNMESPFVRWFWVVKKHNISFQATFQAEGSSEPTILQTVGKKEEEILTEGEFSIDEENPVTGTLKLSFDNSFSILRSKTVKFRIFPGDLSVEIE